MKIPFKKIAIGAAVIGGVVAVVAAFKKANKPVDYAALLASKKWVNSAGKQEVNLTVDAAGNVSDKVATSWKGKFLNESTIQLTNIVDGRTDILKAATVAGLAAAQVDNRQALVI